MLVFGAKTDAFYTLLEQVKNNLPIKENAVVVPPKVVTGVWQNFV